MAKPKKPKGPGDLTELQAYWLRMASRRYRPDDAAGIRAERWLMRAGLVEEGPQGGVALTDEGDRILREGKSIPKWGGIPGGGKPRLAPTERTVMMRVKMPESLLSAADDAAAKDGGNRMRWVRRLLQRELDLEVEP